MPSVKSRSSFILSYRTNVFSYCTKRVFGSPLKAVELEWVKKGQKTHRFHSTGQQMVVGRRLFHLLTISRFFQTNVCKKEEEILAVNALSLSLSLTIFCFYLDTWVSECVTLRVVAVANSTTPFLLPEICVRSFAWFAGQWPTDRLLAVGYENHHHHHTNVVVVLADASGRKTMPFYPIRELLHDRGGGGKRALLMPSSPCTQSVSMHFCLDGLLDGGSASSCWPRLPPPSRLSLSIFPARIASPRRSGPTSLSHCTTTEKEREAFPPARNPPLSRVCRFG